MIIEAWKGQLIISAFNWFSHENTVKDTRFLHHRPRIKTKDSHGLFWRGCWETDFLIKGDDPYCNNPGVFLGRQIHHTPGVNVSCRKGAAASLTQVWIIAAFTRLRTACTCLGWDSCLEKLNHGKVSATSSWSGKVLTGSKKTILRVKMQQYGVQT